MPIQAWKLMRLRKDGSLGSLFINRKERLPRGVWMLARSYPTKGFKERPGWHCLAEPEAPHLTTNGRVWVKVILDEIQEFRRPEKQGGLWFLATWMKIEELSTSE